MTDQEINISIAEACGWIWRKGTPITYGGTHIPAGWINDKDFRLHLPNYCADLNAMHEVEKVLLLRTTDMILYRDNLLYITQRDQHEQGFSHYAQSSLWHLKPKQKAEAFLRTIGKWKE